MLFYASRAAHEDEVTGPLLDGVRMRRRFERFEGHLSSASKGPDPNCTREDQHRKRGSLRNFDMQSASLLDNMLGFALLVVEGC